MPTSEVSAVNKIIHDNFTATTVAATKTLPTNCDTVLINNMGTQTLLISFDGGASFKKLLAQNAIGLDGSKLTSYSIKCDANTCLVECLYGVEN